MKKKLCTVLAAMVFATATFSEKTKAKTESDSSKIPSYLIVKGTKLKGYKDGLPEDLVIPDGVKEIDDGAFKGCRSLKSVTIPSGVKKIGDEVFYGCESLVSVTIPSSVKQISEGGRSWGDMSWIPGAFDRCISLKEIKFGGTVAQWKAVRGRNELPRSVVCIRCSDGFIGVKELPEYLEISGTAVTGYTGKVPVNLVIPEGVKEISKEAFEGCTSLASVTIPSSVKEIGRDAFKGCASLKEIQFGGTTAQWKAIQGSDGIKVSSVRCSDGNIGIADVPEYLKMDGTKVIGYTGKVPANLVIPDGVTAIGGNAFKDCTSIESVTIPSSVKEIVGYAFNGCTYLERVTIAEGVTEIGERSFSGCKSLTSVSIPGSVKEIGNFAFSGCVSLASVVIAEGVTEIGRSAFYGCTSLASVTIPGSVKKIDGFEVYVGAFEGCTSLVSVTIAEGMTEIGVRSFLGCTSLTSVSIPKTVTEIGNGAFKDCTSLRSVVIPDGVKKIYGDSRFGGAFEGCTSLASIAIPDSVESIGECAFYGCKSLASVTIGNGVTKIAGGTFRGCTSLKSVVIPRGVTGIWSGAFDGCTSLTSVTIPRSVTNFDGSFRNCSPNLKINYDGTKAQWGAISKRWWNGSFVVQCTDGVTVEK